jgi:hypothetical protein
MTLPPPDLGATDDAGRAPAAAPDAAPALTRLPQRLWLWTLWYAMGCLAGAAVWGIYAHRTPTQVVVAVIYLLACGLVLFAPGMAIERGALAARLTSRRQRTLLLVLLVVAAGLVIATMSTGRLWWTPLFILLTGNAIWSLDTIDHRLASSPPPAPPAATPPWE